MEKVLRFEGVTEQIVGQLGEFRTLMELERRRGCFGLMGLFRKNLPKDQLERIELAKQVLSQVGQDAKKKQLSGWLDLSGYNSKGKLLRTGKTRSGRTKCYYKDPWFGVKAKLVDGNVIRVVALDHVKEKKGWGAKRPCLQVKLGVNEEVYSVNQPSAMPRFQLGQMPMLVSMKAANDHVRLMVLASAASNVTVTENIVVSGLRSAYGCLVLRRKLARSGGS